MTTRALGLLQWTGLLFGAGIWAAEFVAGYGLTEAECHAAGASWNISNDPWQALLMGLGVAGILAALAAAVAVLLRTRGVSYEDEPPLGRIRFFAIAALAANTFFLVIVVLSGTASIANVACRQS
jgi:hypothetical protein